MNFPIIFLPKIIPIIKKNILNINVDANENKMFIPAVLTIIPCTEHY